MIIKDTIVYQDNTYELTERGAVKGNSTVCFLTTENATQIDGVTLPRPFGSGWYTYIGGEFALTDNGVTQYKKYLINNVDNYATSVEEGGILLGEDVIVTTKESQARITGMWAALQINPDLVVDWKDSSTGSWSVLGITEITVISGAVANHVQACFTREKELSDIINVCTTLEELRAVNIYTGWPENAPIDEV